MIRIILHVRFGTSLTISPKQAPTIMHDSYDLIIAGAGASGLSLLWYLMEEGVTDHQSVLLLDQSFEPSPDKTWCFWNDEHLPLQQLIHKTWPVLEVAVYGNRFTERLQAYQYHCTRSDEYTRTILNRADSIPTIVRKKCSITGYDLSDELGVVHTDQGTYRAPWVFQSVMKPKDYYKQKVDISLLQHFMGVEIETKEPLFDPEKAVLMDFDTSQKHGVTFFYVLPFSETRALVEYTFFTATVLDDDTYRAGIDAYLQNRYKLQPSQYNILREEKGAIPMEDRYYPAKTNERVFNIGTVGGLTKPSTGYTFTRIHRYSKKVASALKRGENPPPVGRPGYRFRVYDLMLLRILRDNPTMGVQIFHDLFKHNKFDRVLQFLEEKTHPGQEIALFSTLPYTPFFRSIYRMKHRIVTGA
ncbi:MAG: lycopene cyclase family protein [Balneolaceae bacterium]